MNILGIGGWELVVIFIIALVIAGPKRMIQWAYIAGKYLGQLRIVWRNMMQTIQKEFDDAGVDIQLPKDIPTRGDVGRIAQKALLPFTAPMKQAMDEVDKEVNTVKQTATDLQVEASMNGKQKHETSKPANTNSSDAEQNSFGTWSSTRPHNG